MEKQPQHHSNLITILLLSTYSFCGKLATPRRHYEMSIQNTTSDSDTNTSNIITELSPAPAVFTPKVLLLLLRLSHPLSLGFLFAHARLVVCLGDI